MALQAPQHTGRGAPSFLAVPFVLAGGGYSLMMMNPIPVVGAIWLYNSPNPVALLLTMFGGAVVGDPVMGILMGSLMGVGLRTLWEKKFQ